MYIRKMSRSSEGTTFSPIVEVATVAVLFLLALVLARPQLEGWGVQRVFQSLGPVQGYLSSLRGAPTRLFEPLPLGAAWLVSRGAPWGVGFVYGVILIGKYLAGRWAAGADTPDVLRWLAGTSAAVMLPWTEQWRGHNMAQQMAALLVVLSFGAALKAARGPGWSFRILAFVTALLALLTYEGVVVCVMALPLFVKLADFHQNRRDRPSSRRVVPPIVLALAIYVAYFQIMQALVPTGYHDVLLAAGSPFRQPARLFSDLYATAYLHGAWTSASVALVVGALCYFVGRTPEGSPTSPRVGALLIACVALLLPLLGLCYAINFYFLMDVERIGLPVGVGLFMLTLSSLGNVRLWDIQRTDVVVACFVSLSLLLGEASNAYTTNIPFRIQDRFLRQVIQTMKADTDGRPLLLRDWTGTLGDLYTFYVTGALQDALAVRGNRTDVELCTADGVDRRWLKFWSVEAGGGLRRCSLVDPVAVDRLVLDYKPDSTGSAAQPRLTAFAIERAPDAGKIVSKIVEGSFSGREGSLAWVNHPRAVISLTNKTSAAQSVVWLAFLTPPPCPAQARVQIALDGISTDVAVAAPTPFRLPTKLQPSETKEIIIDMQSQSCRIEGDSREFYMGLEDMTTLIQ